METEKLRFWDNVLIKVEQSRKFYNSNGRIVTIIDDTIFVFFGKRFEGEFKKNSLRIKGFKESSLEKFNLKDHPEIKGQRIFGDNLFYSVETKESPDGLCTVNGCKKQFKKKIMSNVDGKLIISFVCNHHKWKLHRKVIDWVTFKKGGFQS